MDDAWITRIGSTAARARKTGVVLRRVGLTVLAGAIVLSVTAWVLWRLANGTPSVVAMTITVAAASAAALLGLSCLIAAVSSHLSSADEAWLFVRHSFIAPSAREVENSLRSVTNFDRLATEWSARDAQVPSASNGILAWTPNVQRPILRGATAHSLLAWAHALLGVGVVAGLLLAFLGTGGSFLTPPIWHGSWIGAGVIVGGGALVWIVAAWRSQLEYRAGYATAAVGGFLMSARPTYRMKDLRISVDRIDGKTGYVLRQAGDTRLGPTIYADRLRQIRAAHPNARPLRIPATHNSGSSSPRRR